MAQTKIGTDNINKYYETTNIFTSILLIYINVEIRISFDYWFNDCWILYKCLGAKSIIVYFDTRGQNGRLAHCECENAARAVSELPVGPHVPNHIFLYKCMRNLSWLYV